MKKKKVFPNVTTLRFHMVVFWCGLGLLAAGALSVWLDMRGEGREEIPWQITQAQIKQRRLGAIEAAGKAGSLTYNFEVEGGNFLMMPMTHKEAEEQK